MNDCWTKVEKRLREKFDEYRRLNLFTDVTLIVKNYYGNEVNFPVHRIILSAISPYVMFNFVFYLISCLKLILVRKNVLKCHD